MKSNKGFELSWAVRLEQRVGGPGALLLEDDALPLPSAALDKVLDAVERLHLRPLRAGRGQALVGEVLPPGLPHRPLWADDAAVLRGVLVVLFLLLLCGRVAAMCCCTLKRK